jgi:hypothetical protein
MGVFSHVVRGDALFHEGLESDALEEFEQAEDCQRDGQPHLNRLYSVHGFKYCELLLAPAERAAWQRILGKTPDAPGQIGSICRSVRKRARRTLLRSEAYPGAPMLDLPLNHLTLGRIALYEAIVSSARRDVAEREIEISVSGLRRAGQCQELPRALLTRAWLRAVEGQLSGPDSAQTDLDEAWEIAERQPMRLHMADIHLYRARLFFREADYPWESAQADLAAARKLIEACGYGRRKQELEDAGLVIGTA